MAGSQFEYGGRPDDRSPGLWLLRRRVAAAKVVADFAKTNDKLVIRGGAFAGKALDVNGVKVGKHPFQGKCCWPNCVVC